MLHGGRPDGTLYYLLGQEEKLRHGIAEDPVVAHVDDLLFTAICQQASDIHIQPAEHSYVIRYRIDGVLYDASYIDKAQAHPIVSRLKVLAHMDIAERRIPQDGRFKVRMQNDDKGQERIVDFRIATFPALHGEKMVVRILDRSLRLLSLDTLGLEHDMYQQLKSVLHKPTGLFLVTGPTGCGKTTMLYALISALDVASKNVITIEDPIEYELAGITQSQVNSKAGFTFENGLRAMLRQDPDIIMVGEIRDKPTAHIAIESALTGHLVLSTLHTNDAPSAVARLLEMGIEPFLISATLNGVLAQRLARRLCPACKQKSKPQIASKNLGGISTKDLDIVYVPRGCAQCQNFGYKGRIGIFELLMLNDAIRTLLMQKADSGHLRNIALESGMKSLLHDGIDKVKNGKTSLEEVLPFLLDA